MVRALGAIEPDYETGPALLKSVSEGTAQLGDVSRWTPKAEASATPRVNLGAARELPPPEVAIAQPIFRPSPENEARMAREAGVVEEVAPSWEPTFMPSRRAG